MRKFKIDPKTGKILYKVRPKGLPAIWVEDGLCKRCEIYKKCVGLSVLDDDNWEELKLLLDCRDFTDEFIDEVKERFEVDLSYLISDTTVDCKT